ncbi:chromate resistance protein ChrB domain-containing protein [Sphingobium sp.]|uniref:chromate resistance protein ChrB domain-containing protein n=1 Tax=Sphingobium sp. TaxID=1912891 RepID=UPI003BB5A94C
MTTATDSPSWLALLHQLPAKPPYLRVKIWRRLQAIGAVPLKNAVHVLPLRPDHIAVFQELMEEIIAGGGEATLIEARLLAGQHDGDVRGLFDAARDADYDEIADGARRLIETGPVSGSDIARLQKRLADIIALDFFGAHGRQQAQAALADLDRQLHAHPDVGRAEPAGDAPLDLTGKTWVTRSGVHVDRIACAWLIRRFIDPDAVFRFVDSRSADAREGEFRFDMSDAEFTHEGDRCSFETIVLRAGLAGDAGLVAIAEIIHDLDIGDGKYNRAETSGLGAMLSGVCASTDDDLHRIAMASEALNQFYAYFSARKAE